MKNTLGSARRSSIAGPKLRMECIFCYGYVRLMKQLKSVKRKVYDEPINKRWKHVQYHVFSPVDTLVRRMICDQIGSAIIDL